MIFKTEREVLIADADYGSADHAKKYRSTAGSQDGIDDGQCALWRQTW